EEKIQIEQYIQKLQIEGVFEDPIVTEINSECPFYEAEVEHHDYYNQNTEQPYCQFVIAPKIKKLKSIFNQYTIS
ncbi:MAG: peptide-methionine (S)-S-oxide reductase, partial [Bacteroidota bacterium]|nr:peptide-methionine (S)-S-oxide reductase [Bacteroidota bacterium]